VDSPAVAGGRKAPTGVPRSASTAWVRHLAPTLHGYRRGWLARDVVAGLVLSALLVPQGMAYAELAGLPAVTGLYTSILCLVGYALAGPEATPPGRSCWPRPWP
jgi:hypothetical protein